MEAASELDAEEAAQDAEDAMDDEEEGEGGGLAVLMDSLELMLMLIHLLVA